MSGKSRQAESKWARYKPSEAVPWNLRRVVHLHRRGGFAAPWPILQRDLADGPDAAIDRLLRGEIDEKPAHKDFAPLAQTIGDAAVASGSPGRLKAWWIFRMLMSLDPLRERLTLMWHNHFATSNRKVQDLVAMREQNELLRKYALAPFGQLLKAIVKHPAMLIWLDADSNRKGHPNENLARELMELFTLGIGNYTETDVKEAARALTGWTVVGNHFGFREARHDAGEKQLLDSRGPLDGNELLELLLDHPATPRRLAWRICHAFIAEDTVPEEALSELANGLAARRLDTAWAVQTVLRSERFFAEENMHARITDPVQYAIGAVRSTQLTDPPPSTLLLAQWLQRMGQDLFYPPNVGGWQEGRAWLASRTIVARANFASALAEGRLWHPARKPALAALAGDHCKADDLEARVLWYSHLLTGVADATVVKQISASAVSADREDPLLAAVALLMMRPEHHLA